jgi:hypothetical protein
MPDRRRLALKEVGGGRRWIGRNGFCTSWMLLVHPLQIGRQVPPLTAPSGCRSSWQPPVFLRQALRVYGVTRYLKLFCHLAKSGRMRSQSSASRRSRTTAGYPRPGLRLGVENKGVRKESRDDLAASCRWRFGLLRWGD